MRFWSATKWLIAINVAIFILDILAGRRLTAWGAFSADAAIYHVQLWRWLTYEFLHADPYHIFFNMIALAAFGPVLEERLQRRRYVVFYLLSGIGGVLGYLALWRLHFLNVSGETDLIGASACIYGVMIGAAHVAPNRVYRFYWTVTLTLRSIAWICFGLSVLMIVYRAENAGGEAAHLGGAAVGFVLIRNMSLFQVLRIAPRKQRFWRPGDPSTNFFRKDV